MADITTKKPTKNHEVTVSARRRFGGYTPEQRQEVRPLDAKECDNIVKIRIAWTQWEYGTKEYSGDDQSKYNLTDDYLTGISPSADDVKKFVDMLADLQHEERDSKDFKVDVGIFLSALVNRGCDEEYEIDTKKFDELIQSLGYENCKKLRILGDAGMFAGMMMNEKGHIIIEGDAESVGTSLAGGTIIVKGDVYGAGTLMSDGTIEVYGVLSGEIGADMSDGTIIAHNGFTGYIDSHMYGGTIHITGGKCPRIPNDNNVVAIYHNGKCIADGQGGMDDW